MEAAQKHPFDPVAYMRAVHAARFTNPKLEHLALKMLAASDDAGICNRSVPELCNAIGVGKRQLANLRRELDAEGFVTLEERGLGRGHMSKWRLIPQAGNTATSSPLNAAREPDALQTAYGTQSTAGDSEAFGIKDSAGCKGLADDQSLQAPLSSSDTFGQCAEALRRVYLTDEAPDARQQARAALHKVLGNWDPAKGDGLRQQLASIIRPAQA